MWGFLKSISRLLAYSQFFITSSVWKQISESKTLQSEINFRGCAHWNIRYLYAPNHSSKFVNLSMLYRLVTGDTRGFIVSIWPLFCWFAEGRGWAATQRLRILARCFSGTERALTPRGAALCSRDPYISALPLHRGCTLPHAGRLLSGGKGCVLIFHFPQELEGERSGFFFSNVHFYWTKINA